MSQYWSESESENERQSGVHVITESESGVNGITKSGNSVNVILPKSEGESCVNVILPESESGQKVKVARQWKWCKCYPRN